MPILSVVVPCYNSAAYMGACLDSLLSAGAEDIEILVIDDGSSDETAAIADAYERDHPGQVRAVHQENKGHGGAINTGLALATGEFIKVVDSDDWVGREELVELLAELRRLSGEVDLVISNFVYEKLGKRNKTVMRYDEVLPAGRVFGWDEIGRLGLRKYFLMHAFVYRTDLLRECGLALPEHTFYVDNLYAFAPLPHVKRIYYVNVDLYRYFIGRSDQSVAEDVMMRRIDQQLRVNRLMLASMPRRGEVTPGLERYMLHYLEILCAVSSALLTKIGTQEALARKGALWSDIRAWDEDLYFRLRRRMLGVVTNLPGSTGRRVTRWGYLVAQRAIGFN
ncbi:MAG: glycosyltransferase family 2 protein [Propioniciclava sp.]